MTLYELSDITNTVVVLERSCMVEGRRWIAHLRTVIGRHYAEVKDSPASPIIGGGVGWGDTPDRSMRDLCNNIKGKLLVVDPLNNRKEFQIPKTLRVNDESV
jgi:hypothetical protein